MRRRREGKVGKTFLADASLPMNSKSSRSPECNIARHYTDGACQMLWKLKVFEMKFMQKKNVYKQDWPSDWDFETRDSNLWTFYIPKISFSNEFLTLNNLRLLSLWTSGWREIPRRDTLKFNASAFIICEENCAIRFDWSDVLWRMGKVWNRTQWFVWSILIPASNLHVLIIALQQHRFGKFWLS